MVFFFVGIARVAVIFCVVCWRSWVVSCFLTVCVSGFWFVVLVFVGLYWCSLVFVLMCCWHWLVFVGDNRLCVIVTTNVAAQT